MASISGNELFHLESYIFAKLKETDRVRRVRVRVLLDSMQMCQLVQSYRLLVGLYQSAVFLDLYTFIGRTNERVELHIYTIFHTR